MAEWYRNDTAVDDYYRDRYQSIYGYDPLDPDWAEDDISDFEEEEDV